MTVKSGTYYWIICDWCGDEGGEERNLFPESKSLEGDVEWLGFTTAAGKHACPECGPINACEDCGTLVGGPEDRLAGERDYYCPECWKKKLKEWGNEEEE